MVENLKTNVLMIMDEPSSCLVPAVRRKPTRIDFSSLWLSKGVRGMKVANAMVCPKHVKEIEVARSQITWDIQQDG